MRNVTCEKEQWTGEKKREGEGRKREVEGRGGEGKKEYRSVLVNLSALAVKIRVKLAHFSNKAALLVCVEFESVVLLAQCWDVNVLQPSQLDSAVQTLRAHQVNGCSEPGRWG